MEIERKFHPIGQGAFYTEKLPNLNVIYDCGGSNKAIVEEAIKKTFQKNEQIDAVFISHFHRDHINGLEFLLKYCNVKKVILPALTDSQKILYVVQNTINNEYVNEFSNRLIFSPEELLKESSCALVEVTEEEVGEDAEEIPLSEKLPRTITSGRKFSSGVDGWLYVPFHIADQTTSDKLLKSLKSKGIDVNKANIVDKLKKQIKTIRAVYEEVIGDKKNTGRNANSLCVYSGPKNKASEYGSLTFQSKECIFRDSSGCLYMGDFEATPQNLSALRSAYDNYWSFISIVQIPHHGSKENFSTDLINKDKISVISADPSKYNHPSESVIKQILIEGAKLVLVTNEPSTMVVQLIDRSIAQYPRLNLIEICEILKRTFPELAI